MIIKVHQGTSCLFYYKVHDYVLICIINAPLKLAICKSKQHSVYMTEKGRIIKGERERKIRRADRIGKEMRQTVKESGIVERGFE